MPVENLQSNIDNAFGLIQHNQMTEASVLCKKLSDTIGPNPLVSFLFAAIDLKNGELVSAIEHLKTAIRLDPAVTEYHLTLANTQRSLGNYEDAIEHYENALKLSPGSAGILNNYGLALTEKKRYPDAIKAFQDALDENPNLVLARLNLAKLLRSLGQKKDAIDCLNGFESEVAATFAVTKAAYQLPVIPVSIQDMKQSRADYEREVMALSDIHCEINEELLLYAGTNFFAVYQGVDDKIFQEIIASFYLRNCFSLNYVAPNLAAGPVERIKIGFISSNFNNHTVGKLYRGLIAKLNRELFDVTVFSSHPPSDEISNFIKNNSDHNVTLVRDLNAARETISKRELNILFYTDIGMDTFTYFLAFSRLAPVQCVGWGHGVTTGIPTIDYFISNIDIEEDDPVAAQSHYSEKLILLSQPPTYLYPVQKYDPREMPDLFFAESRTLYCCPQSSFKIHPEFDPLLIEILRQDETGVAVFIENWPGWSDILMTRWRRIDEKAAQRIHFLPKLDQNSFLALVDRADVILDTIYTCGGISSAEALAHGTPIVTWPNTPLLFARVTNGYYHQIGVTDCIAGSALEYINIAVQLGQDIKWRDQISNKIKNRSRLLFNRSEIIREFEEFFKNALETI